MQLLLSVSSCHYGKSSCVKATIQNSKVLTYSGDKMLGQKIKKSMCLRQQPEMEVITHIILLCLYKKCFYFYKKIWESTKKVDSWLPGTDSLLETGSGSGWVRNFILWSQNVP